MLVTEKRRAPAKHSLSVLLHPAFEAFEDAAFITRHRGTVLPGTPSACLLSTDRTHCLQIPPEVFALIARKLPSLDLEALSLTCKRWRAAVRDVAQVARLRLPHSANSKQLVAEASRLFPASTIIITSNAAQMKLWPVPACCNILHFSTEYSTETRFRRASERIVGGTKTEKLSKSLTEIKQAKAALAVAISCDLGMRVKSRDLLRVTASRDDVVALSPSIRHLHADENGFAVVSRLQLNRLRMLAFTMCRTSEEALSLAAAIANMPCLEEVYVHCTSVDTRQHVPLLLTEMTSQRDTRSKGITTLGIALDIHEPLGLEIPAVTLAGVTALELSKGVLVDRLPNTLGSLRLTDVEGLQMLAQLQHSNMTRLTLQHAVGLHLVPGNLQSLTLVNPFSKEQIINHEVSAGLECLRQLRELMIGNFITEDVVAELLLVSLPFLVTFGFRVHHFSAVQSDPCWDQSSHIFYSSSDKPVARNGLVAEPMFLRLPTLVSALGASFGELRIIQVYSFNTGPYASIGLNCTLLTTEHFPNLFGLTCKFWNSEVVLHNVSKGVYVVAKASRFG